MNNGIKIVIGIGTAVVLSYAGYVYWKRYIQTPTLEITKYSVGDSSFDYKTNTGSSATILYSMGTTGFGFGKNGMIEVVPSANKKVTFITKRYNKAIKTQTFDFSKSAPNKIKL